MFDYNGLFSEQSKSARRIEGGSTRLTLAVNDT